VCYLYVRGLCYPEIIIIVFNLCIQKSQDKQFTVKYKRGMLLVLICLVAHKIKVICLRKWNQQEGYDQVVGFCEHSNETLNSIKGRNVLTS
jgi:hypothetical protein